MSRLPPLNSLRAFEASARNRSLTKAANELHVTPGAVSKQFRQLEQHFGFPLAVKSRDKFVLTPEGQQLYAKISQSFSLLEDAVVSLEKNPIAGRIVVRCMPAFAARWLIPRLARFYERYEQVEVQVLSLAEFANPFADGVADVAIGFGDPLFNRADGILLKKMEFFPVCSPVLMNQGSGIFRNRDLLGHVLLDGMESTHWNDWFSHHRIPLPPTVRRVYFEDFGQNLVAARVGLGIAMGDNVTTAEDLAQGTLVRPLKGSLQGSPNGYYILTPKGREKSPIGKVFVDWLVSEAHAGSE